MFVLYMYVIVTYNTSCSRSVQHILASGGIRTGGGVKGREQWRAGGGEEERGWRGGKGVTENIG